MAQSASIGTQREREAAGSYGFDQKRWRRLPATMSAVAQVPLCSDPIAGTINTTGKEIRGATMDTTKKRPARILRFSEFCEMIDRGVKQRKRQRQQLRAKRTASQPFEYDGAGNEPRRTDAGTFIYAMELIPEP